MSLSILMKLLNHTLLLLLATTLGACKLTIVKTDCLEVIASEVSRDGILVSAEAVRFRTGSDCKPMKAVSYRSFRERNSVPGYQADGNPPDVLVSQIYGDAGSQPSHEVSISSIDNRGQSNSYADSWEVSVEYPDGDKSVFSGNF